MEKLREVTKFEYIAVIRKTIEYLERYGSANGDHEVGEALGSLLERLAKVVLDGGTDDD